MSIILPILTAWLLISDSYTKTNKPITFLSLLLTKVYKPGVRPPLYQLVKEGGQKFGKDVATNPRGLKLQGNSRGTFETLEGQYPGIKDEWIDTLYICLRWTCNNWHL